MTEYYTCHSARWLGCGKVHTSRKTAERCCAQAKTDSLGYVERGPMGPDTRTRTEGVATWMDCARRDIANKHELSERWLCHSVGPNKLGVQYDLTLASLGGRTLERMRDGDETDVCRRGTKAWTQARRRQRLAKAILEEFGYARGERIGMRNVVRQKMDDMKQGVEPAGLGPDTVEPHPDTDEPSAEPKRELSEKAKVLRDLLELDDMETQVFERVMSKIVDNEDLLDKVCARANVPRSVVFTRPDMEPVTVTGHQHPDLEIVMQAINGGVNRVFTWGSPGLGKTHAMKQVAEALDMPFFLQTPVSDQYQLLGFRDASGDYHESEVYRWATCEGPAMLLLDEVDGCHPNAVLALNALLENKTGVFPTGRVEFGDEKVATATANTPLDGATAKHNARFMQDGAFKDRWVLQFKWTDDPHTEQMIAQIKSGLGGDELRHAVQSSRKVRSNLEENGIQIEWGPRRTFAVARLVAAGFTCKKACELSGLHRLDEGQRKRALTGVGAL